MWSYAKTGDPEGVFSTVPAIVTGISGLLIGQLINRPLPKLEIVKKMAFSGLLLVALGLLWNTVFPTSLMSLHIEEAQNYF